jgi:hypothetical protein
MASLGEVIVAVTAHTVLLLLAALFFLIEAIPWPARPVNFLALGLFFLALGLVVP